MKSKQQTTGDDSPYSRAHRSIFRFNMSESFIDDLELPKPGVCLGFDSVSHSIQTARIMKRFGCVLLRESPQVVDVVGGSKFYGCARVGDQRRGAAEVVREKHSIPTLVHFEAGLCSFDRSTPMIRRG